MATLLKLLLRQALLACTLLSLLHADRCSGAVILDTDGTIEQLLTIATLLKPQGSTTSDTVKLIVVSANGKGPTHAAAAYSNVLSFLATANSAHVPVVMGEAVSWGDRQRGATGLRQSLDSLNLPATSAELVAGRAPYWSQYDDDSLFGIASQLQSTTASTSFLQSVQATPATSLAFQAIQAVLQGLWQGSVSAFERVDYVAMASLTSIASFVNGSDPMFIAKLNVHILQDPSAGFRLDPRAAQFIFAYPNLYRKLVLPSVTDPVSTYGPANWASLTTLAAAPPAISTLIAGLQAKATLVQQTTAQPFASGPYGPRVALGAFSLLRPNIKQLMSDVDLCKATIDLDSGALSYDVLEDGTSITATHLFSSPFPNPSVFWTELLYLLGADKAWMKSS